MSAGLEVLVNRLLGTGDDRPLRHRADKIGRDGLPCPLCGGKSLGIDYAPHNATGEWIIKAWCRSGQHSDVDGIAAAVGLSSADIREGNEALRYKYRPPSAKPLPKQRLVDEWKAALWADPDKLDRLRAFGISDEVLRDVDAGWDGGSYTFPVYEPFSTIGRAIVNVRRYSPDPPDGTPKWLSWPGSGAQLYPDVPDGTVVLTEGEKDLLVARSLGFPALTNNGGALCWRHDTWGTRLAGRRVFIVYDRDRAGVAGAKKVAASLRSVGCSVVVVRLPLPFRPTHGPDLTDFVTGGGDLRSLLNESYLAAKRREPRPKPRLSLPVAPGQPHSVTRGHA